MKLWTKTLIASPISNGAFEPFLTEITWHEYFLGLCSLIIRPERFGSSRNGNVSFALQITCLDSGGSRGTWDGNKVARDFFRREARNRLELMVKKNIIEKLTVDEWLRFNEEPVDTGMFHCEARFAVREKESFSRGGIRVFRELSDAFKMEPLSMKIGETQEIRAIHSRPRVTQTTYAKKGGKWVSYGDALLIEQGLLPADAIASIGR